MWLKSTTASPRINLELPGSIMTDSGRTFFATETEEVTDVTESCSEAKVDANDGAIEVLALDIDGAGCVVLGTLELTGEVGSSTGAALFSISLGERGCSWTAEKELLRAGDGAACSEDKGRGLV